MQFPQSHCDLSDLHLPRRVARIITNKFRYKILKGDYKLYTVTVYFRSGNIIHIENVLRHDIDQIKNNYSAVSGSNVILNIGDYMVKGTMVEGFKIVEH